MVFSSTTFLFLFLPGFLALYALLSITARPRHSRRPLRLRNLGILLSSLLFYAWGEKLFVLVMLYSTILDYFLALVITDQVGSRRVPPQRLVPGGPRTPVQRLALALSIFGNLLVLGLFKYFNFFVASYNSAAAALGLGGAVWHDAIAIALPIGISFYTFQSMSYTIDVYRGRIEATRSFVDFACFVTMFPQLVAGPIVRFKEIAEELVARRVDLEAFAAGVRRFAVGLAKKVLVANVVAGPADRVFALPHEALTMPLAWAGVLLYTIQIYFDFSGYSDMAIGLGRMLGFTFPENFAHPYASRSVREFWRRWHMTLSTWFRDYLYLSLGGSRVGPLRLYRNLVLVFLLCGLWHGAAWTFVVWGLFHGAFLVAERAGLERLVGSWPRAARHFYLLAVVVVGWVLFRSPTFGGAGAMLAAMAGLGASSSTETLARLMTPEVVAATVAGVAFSAPLAPALTCRLAAALDPVTLWDRAVGRTALAAGRLALTTLALVLSISWLASGTYNPFIYFRF